MKRKPGQCEHGSCRRKATYAVLNVREDGSIAECRLACAQDAALFGQAPLVLKSLDQADRHGNVVAKEGCDRCWCGSKYWEHDRCVDCGTPVWRVEQEASV